MLSNVTIEDKLVLLQSQINAIMDGLGQLAAGGEMTGDDLVEFFALGIAAVIDHDTEQKTPRDIRMAAEGVGRLIEQRTKDFRRISATSGMSALDVLRSGVPISPQRGPVN